MPKFDDRYLADNIFECIFSTENVKISNKILLQYVPRVGDKPLPEPMMI